MDGCNLPVVDQGRRVGYFPYALEACRAPNQRVERTSGPQRLGELLAKFKPRGTLHRRLVQQFRIDRIRRQVGDDGAQGRPGQDHPPGRICRIMLESRTKIAGRMHVHQNGEAQPDKLCDPVANAAEHRPVACRDKIAVHWQADRFEPGLPQLLQRRRSGSNTFLAFEPSGKIEATRRNGTSGRCRQRGRDGEGEGRKQSPASKCKRMPP
ncbi:hypothetical protein AJ88_26895 [Mesorhizobium amorphae CCBAU 01583]|nr:hypothetical protein AJ88_26895 [Mesorhizobium amorphae CCBAU 01583]